MSRRIRSAGFVGVDGRRDARGYTSATYGEEFYRMLEGVIIDDAEVFNDQLRKWEDYYNCHRPHGGLGGQTPYERLKHTTTQA
ncbi:hypothetical protein Pth03_46580 [Planotetraspora thailandica]|uniref:Integrase catalytic domain-containing protein n=1 Tax=Planotetraspora thailandica TaxID=487172 RepID=A0A8J3XX70_9ACTN|nr:integrase core domain-containing protein [Planotetraspora thailandica]GII56269.1 hypothetical protein Pth03_46580 [Planotetraspora thailandica]